MATGRPTWGELSGVELGQLFISGWGGLGSGGKGNSAHVRHAKGLNAAIIKFSMLF
jgi:hypothetical protein